MGIKNGSQILFKMNNVVKAELDLILNYTKTKYASNTNTTATSSINTLTNQTTIDIDISNVIHTIAFRHSGIYNTNLVRETAKFLQSLAADTGYVVIPVLDGDIRPQSKRESFRRRFDSTMDTMNSFYCRQAAMKLAAIKDIDRTNIEKQKLVSLNKEAKRLDKSSRLILPLTFQDDLENQLEEIGAYIPDRQSNGKVSRQTIKAYFESDYTIAYRVRNRKTDLVYSSDGDMTALCGPNTICIRSFKQEKGSRKKRKDGENVVFVYEITGGSNTLMDEIKTKINTILPSSKIIYKEAKYPIFERIIPPWLTALYCVGLGCDVFPGSIHNITPLFLTTQLEKMNINTAVSSSDYQKIFDALVDIYVIRQKPPKTLTKQDFLTYCQAFLYQPGIEEGLRDDPSQWNYVYHQPTSLHPYLKMFAHPDSCIVIENEENNVNMSTLKQCKGITSITLPHKFLSCEAWFTCSLCQQCFCATCGYSPKKDRDGKNTKHSLVHYDNMDNDLCCDCYKEQRIYSPYGCDLDEILNIQQMQDYLREKNVMMTSGEIDAHEIQELYELTLLEECTENNHDEVPFPLFPSDALILDKETNKFEFGKLVQEIEMINGGQFINSPVITDNILTGLLKLFATIVRFDNDETTIDKKRALNSVLSDVIPSQLVNFASNARVGSGYRLLKRCLRHALDPKAPPLHETKATIFISDDGGVDEKEIGLILTNKVSASMKDAAYCSTVAFTCDKIQCAKCECQAGASTKERVLCVHNLPLIYQLVMLLDDGLAEHILIELCS